MLTRTEAREKFYDYFLSLNSDDVEKHFIKFLNLIPNPYGNMWDELSDEYKRQWLHLSDSLFDNLICYHPDYKDINLEEDNSYDINLILNLIYWKTSLLWIEPYKYLYWLFLDGDDVVFDAMQIVSTPQNLIDLWFSSINI